MFIFIACQKQEFKSDFELWASEYSYEDLEMLYESLNPSLNELRVTDDSIKDLLIVDHIIEYVEDTLNASGQSVYRTLSLGITVIYYKDQHLFTGTWGREYMSPYNLMTVVNFGEVFDYKLIRITNQTPDVGREHRLYLYSDECLERVKLEAYGLGKIKMTSKDNVIMIYSFDFNRSKDPEQRYILYNLNTKESFVRSKKY